MDKLDLIQVTTWTGTGDHMDRFDLIEMITWTGLT